MRFRGDFSCLVSVLWVPFGILRLLVCDTKEISPVTDKPDNWTRFVFHSPAALLTNLVHLPPVILFWSSLSNCYYCFHLTAVFWMKLWAGSPLGPFSPSVLEENLPSVLWHCWMGGSNGIRPLKNEGWWRWALITLDGVAPSRMVGMSASVILPCTIKSRGRFLLAPAYPGSPWKRVVKRLCVCVCSGRDSVGINERRFLQSPNH